MRSLIYEILFEQLVKFIWSLRINNLIYQCQCPDFNGYIMIMQENVLVYKKCILKCLRKTVHHVSNLSNGSGAI